MWLFSEIDNLCSELQLRDIVTSHTWRRVFADTNNFLINRIILVVYKYLPILQAFFLLILIDVMLDTECIVIFM